MPRNEAIDERTALLVKPRSEVEEELSTTRKRLIVVASLVTGFLATLDMTSE